jgi:hypothetical protein
MERSSLAISIGAVCFGIVVGSITYRTLVRKGTAVITDIAGVIAAIGGGTVTVWFDQSGGDSFAYYSMGLLAGMVLYYVQFRSTNTREVVAGNLGFQEAQTATSAAQDGAPDEREEIEGTFG